MLPPLPPAVLLVDGYNIIGIWPSLTKTRDRHGMEAARRNLTEILINYSAYQAYDTRLVFDAYYRDSPSNREEISNHLSVHYTDFGQTADTYIEKTCATFSYEMRYSRQRLIVATSDRAQQLTVVGYGAECLSALQLSYEVEAITHQVSRKQRSGKKTSSRFLASSLDPISQERLAKLRLGL